MIAYAEPKVEMPTLPNTPHAMARPPSLDAPGEAALSNTANVLPKTERLGSRRDGAHGSRRHVR